MRIFGVFVACCALAASLAGCVSIGANSFSRDESLSLPATHLQILVLKAANGDINLSSADISAIEVHAHIEANDPVALPHDTVRFSRRGTTAVVSSVCDYKHVVLWSVQNCGIDYDIRYPKTMALSVTNVNGDITITGSRAAVDAVTTNGDVTVHGASADVSAQSHEGNVTVSLSNAWRGRRITASTRFGDVLLYVPDTFRGRVRAHTVAGDIHGFSSIASGPPSVDLSTTFGDVTITHAR
jgi:hypothetical protein